MRLPRATLLPSTWAKLFVSLPPWAFSCSSDLGLQEYALGSVHRASLPCSDPTEILARRPFTHPIVWVVASEGRASLQSPNPYCLPAQWVVSWKGCKRMHTDSHGDRAWKSRLVSDSPDAHHGQKKGELKAHQTDAWPWAGGTGPCSKQMAQFPGHSAQLPRSSLSLTAGLVQAAESSEAFPSAPCSPSRSTSRRANLEASSRGCGLGPKVGGREGMGCDM